MRVSRGTPRRSWTIQPGQIMGRPGRHAGRPPEDDVVPPRTLRGQSTAIEDECGMKYARDAAGVIDGWVRLGRPPRRSSPQSTIGTGGAGITRARIPGPPSSGGTPGRRLCGLRREVRWPRAARVRRWVRPARSHAQIRHIGKDLGKGHAARRCLHTGRSGGIATAHVLISIRSPGTVSRGGIASG